MPRRPNRLFAALLWLAIALLPLRGVAAVWMHGAPATLPIAVAGGHDEHADGTAVHPCHSQATAHDPAPGDTASPANSTHGCQLCDLCHSGVAIAPEAPAVLPIAAALSLRAQPVVAPARNSPDGLYRPPR